MDDDADQAYAQRHSLINNGGVGYSAVFLPGRVGPLGLLKHNLLVLSPFSAFTLISVNGPIINNSLFSLPIFHLCQPMPIDNFWNSKNRSKT